MAKWPNSVRSTNRLSVYNNIQGRWAAIFRRGLSDTNRLLRHHGVRIEFREVSDQNAANIVIASANGMTTIRNGARTFQIPIDGSRLHGHTYKVVPADVIEKAFVLLPESPLLNTPRGQRATGTRVMRAIMVHEYIHSIGLGDEDHASDDVFIGYPDYLPGGTPEQDRLGVMRGGRHNWFPPYILSGPTVTKIQRAWS